MAHILLVKRDPVDGSLQALCHRRGKHIREPFHWGIPGGGFDRDERHLMISPQYADIRNEICRRAAVRETIEECGGGEHEFLQPQHVSFGTIEGCDIRAAAFTNIILPPGLLNMLHNPTTSRLIRAKYGHSKAKQTNVFVYVMHPEIDADFLSHHWHPRAIRHYRNEIHEAYDKADCSYGSKWITLERLITTPLQPVQESSMPLCEFLVNLFQDMSAELLAHIQDLETQQISDPTSESLINISSKDSFGQESYSMADETDIYQNHISPPHHNVGVVS